MLSDVGLDEALEGGDVAGALVVDTGLVGLGEELDRGEATDAVLGGELLVSGRIDLSDHNLALLRRQLLPRWGHADAVTAPRGKELDEDVLRGVVDDGVVVLRGELHDGGSAHECEQGDNGELLEHVWM